MCERWRGGPRNKCAHSRGGARWPAGNAGVRTVSGGLSGVVATLAGKSVQNELHPPVVRFALARAGGHRHVGRKHAVPDGLRRAGDDLAAD